MTKIAKEEAKNKEVEIGRRRKELDKADITYTEDWLEKSMEEMPEAAAFDEYVKSIAPDPNTIVTGEKSEREIELENQIEELKRQFEQKEKSFLTQDDIDSIIEKKMAAMNLNRGQNVSNEQNLQIMRGMTDAIEQITQSNNGGRVILQPIMRHEIDEDDVLDTPAFFFSFYQSYTVWGDVKRGQGILNPLRRPIKFEHEFRTVKQGQGREKEVIAISKARIISKKEADYLRNHSEFNIRIFEQLGEATTADAHMAEIMTQVHGSVANLDQHQLIQKCRSLHLPMEADLDAMKKKLIRKLADDQMRNINSQKQAVRTVHPTATQELEGGRIETAQTAI